MFIKTTKLIILGSGPAGYTASIYSSRANLNPILITGIELGGQLSNANEIENWPGNININGYDLMNNMYNHVKNLGVNIINDYIIKVDLKSNIFKLIGEKYQYLCNSLIIATGSTAKYLGLSSEKKFKGKGVSACAVCDGYFYKNKEIAVIGGGNTAISEALYLSNFTKKIHLIHRGNKFTAEKILINRIMKKVDSKEIILYFNFIVNEILGDSNGVTGISIFNKNNNMKLYISLYGVFIAIGHNPNTSIFKNQLSLNNGYINVKSGSNGNSTLTSVPGVFAAGDVIDKYYRQAITSAASGCMAALDAEQYLSNI